MTVILILILVCVTAVLIYSLLVLKRLRDEIKQLKKTIWNYRLYKGGREG